MSDLDLAPMKDFICRCGVVKTLGKHDYLLRQNENCTWVGYIETGMFRFLRTDTDGEEHIVGYSFQDSFVSEYSSCLCGRPSLADIQALVPSTVYLMPYARLKAYWDSSMEAQRLGRIVAEQLFAMSYRRLLDCYCSTPEERYLELMSRYPDLKEMRPLKEIASFIGVTPETVSAIRRRLREKGKS